MTLNIDFLSSPAYRLPPMRIMRRAMCSTMNVPVRVPCFSGVARNSGACSTAKFGWKVGSALAYRGMIEEYLAR